MIKRALISVSNKHGLEDLVRVLMEFDVEIIASSGTASMIKNLGYENVLEVSEFTGHEESPEGLLKTLHPKIHGGILLNRDDPEHKRYMERNSIQPFDLVVVNLYPFEEVVKKKGDLIEAVRNIDIGGPAMIRSAAKASLLFNRVSVIVDPSQYDEFVHILRVNQGSIPLKFKRRLAAKAFKRTAEYEAAIDAYLRRMLRGE